MTPTNNDQNQNQPQAMRRYGQPIQQMQQRFQSSPAGNIANWYQRRRQQQQAGDQQMNNSMVRQPQMPASPNTPGPAAMAPQGPVPQSPAPDTPPPMPNTLAPAQMESPPSTAQPPPMPQPINTERPGGARLEQEPPITSPPTSGLMPDTGQAGSGQAMPAPMSRHPSPARYFDDQQESGGDQMMADGGIVSTPTRAVLGERGPEAVIPLNPTANARLHPTGFLKARYQRPVGPASAPGPIRSALPMSQNRTYR